ncbi:MAG: DUF3144 domain-containing protein [Proteobacteria bacterium]|nr:DUF3144 domain-containing protein [Pseudomonadota bacterium]MBS0218140.1 DUF3144 domain-containing protein [Pseudomonadota bacterium]
MTDSFQPAGQPNQLDPEFFVCSNTYLNIANQQARQQGLRRVSGAILYAAARYNVHAYLGFETDVKGTSADFLDYMTGLYRNMLEEHLASFANERGIDLGLAAAEPSANASGEPMPPV